MRNLIQYYIQIFKTKHLAFLSVNALSLVVIFFILDGPNDTFIYRVLYYLIGLLLGGWIAYKFAVSADDTNTNSLRKIRNGSIITLVLITSSLYFRSDQNTGNSESSGTEFSTSPSTGDYPKACKASCGYEITGPTYDCDGYHCTCVPGEDGESAFEKARKL